MKNKFICRALFGVGLTAIFLLAQNAPPSSPAQMLTSRITRLTTLLGLNSSQQSQATTIFTDEQTASSSAMGSMRTARKALETAIESNDTASISTEASHIGALTTQDTEARAKAEAAFWAILTPDQQTKYKQLTMRGPGERGAFGHPPL